MKKYVLSILLFCGIISPQKIDDAEFLMIMGKAFNKSFTPFNLPIDTTESYVYFYGSKTTTKVSKDSGGTRAIPYMRVWRDSVDYLEGDVFTVLSAGWELSATYDTLTNTPQGGIQSYVAVRYDTTRGLLKYSYSFDLLDRTAGAVKIAVYNNTGVPIIYNSVEGIEYNTNGTHSGTITAYSGNFVRFIAGFICNGTFDGTITNFSLIPTVDSTQGYTHTIIRPADTTTFYYSQSVKWKQKDGDWIWVAAPTDTIPVYPYEAPASSNENHIRSIEGDYIITLDGDTLETLGFIQFDFLEQFNNGEKNEADSICNGSVFAVLSERKRTIYT